MNTFNLTKMHFQLGTFPSIFSTIFRLITMTHCCSQSVDLFYVWESISWQFCSSSLIGTTLYFVSLQWKINTVWCSCKQKKYIKNDIIVRNKKVLPALKYDSDKSTWLSTSTINYFETHLQLTLFEDVFELICCLSKPRWNFNK